MSKYLLTQSEIARIAGVKNQAIQIQASKLGTGPARSGGRSLYPPSTTRKILESRGFKYPKFITSFQMLKGGSTKTATAFNTLVRLNQYGARVLVIDADGQGNMTRVLSKGIDLSESTILTDLIKDKGLKIRDAIVRVGDGIDLIPSDFGNASADIHIFTQGESIPNLISDIIAPVRDDYDFIVFDCNPALSALNNSIAFACDFVTIPVNPDPFAYDGLEETLCEFNRMSEKHRKAIPYRLVFTLHSHETLSRDYLITYGTKFMDRLFNSTIRRSVEVRNAIEENKSIFEISTSRLRSDFDQFALELLGWTSEGEKGAVDAGL